MILSKAFKLVALCVAIIVGSISVVHATRPKTPEPQWKELERELVSEGIRTDVKALLNVITMADIAPSKKWLAIELLGLRDSGSQLGEIKNGLKEFHSITNDLLLKETAALALARLHDDEGMKLLRGYFGASTIIERKIYLAARLAALGDVVGYPLVLRAASSVDPKEKIFSVNALLEFISIGKSEGIRNEEGLRLESPVDRLLTLLTDNDKTVRRTVVNTIPLMVNRGADVALLKRAIEKAISDETDRDIKDMMQSVRLLIQ